jgi:hypothetical protein
MINKIEDCVDSVAGGGQRIDIERLTAVVTADNAVAAQYVTTYAINQAIIHPAFMALALAVAHIFRMHFHDSSLINAISETLERIDGWDEFYEAISPPPEATKVGNAALRAAREWWNDHLDEDRDCSECREAIPVGDGFMLKRDRTVGTIRMRFGTEHLCRACMRRWIGRRIYDA